MPTALYQVDAFADKPFTGNPAESQTPNRGTLRLGSAARARVDRDGVPLVKSQGRVAQITRAIWATRPQDVTSLRTSFRAELSRIEIRNRASVLGMAFSLKSPLNFGRRCA